MRPYKLRHKPTGLFWQPKKHRGSHLSKTGKIYQTKANVLTLGYYSDSRPREVLTISAYEDCLVFKQTKDIISWQKSTYAHKEYQADTPVSDWEIVEI